MKSFGTTFVRDPSTAAPLVWTDILNLVSAGASPIRQFIGYASDWNAVLPELTKLWEFQGGVMIIGISPKTCQVLGSTLILSELEPILKSQQLNIHTTVDWVDHHDKRVVLVYVQPKWMNSAPDINIRQREALNYLMSHPSIENRTYRALFGVSHKTAHYELVELVESGHLMHRGKGRNTRYILGTAAPSA